MSDTPLPNVGGEGIIYVSAEIWHELGRPATKEAWRDALLLSKDWIITEIISPGEYTYDIFFSTTARSYALHVRHPSIPIVTGGQSLPTVSPVYRREAVLDRVEIHHGAKTIYAQSEQSQMKEAQETTWHE